MKLIVTGGAGFIGSAVVRRALADGHHVLNIDSLTYAANLENLKTVAQHADYKFEHANICDTPKMVEIFEQYHPDAIMHLAAESHVDRSIDGPSDFIKTNISGTFSLLEVARAYWTRNGSPTNFRFHHISTDEVYGSLGPSGAFHETSPYAPTSPYSASKAASDHLVRAWHETYGLPTIITNCSNNYGPFHFPEKLIPIVILNAIAGRKIPIYGNGQNIRDWLFVEDHADALLCALTRGKIGRTYNIGGENEVKNIDLVHMICAILDQKLPENAPHSQYIDFVSDRPGHDLRYAIDPSRIREELGWRPSFTVQEGLERTVAWYLENKAWWQAILEQHSIEKRLGHAP